MLKLSELVAKVLRLESHLTAEAKDELAKFRADVTAQVTKQQEDLLASQASTNDLTAKLATANTDLSAATGQLSEINLALKAAASALKLDLKADATPVETVAAIQSSVSATLAKLNVPVNVIPAPKPSDTATASTGGKRMSMDEFRKLAPSQKAAFCREANLGNAQLTD